MIDMESSKNPFEDYWKEHPDAKIKADKDRKDTDAEVKARAKGKGTLTTTAENELKGEKVVLAPLVVPTEEEDDKDEEHQEQSDGKKSSVHKAFMNKNMRRHNENEEENKALSLTKTSVLQTNSKKFSMENIRTVDGVQV